MTYEEIQARLQLKIIEISQLPQEEFDEAAKRISQLTIGLQDTAEAITHLNVLFGIASPEDGENPAVEPPLCLSCANPCLRAEVSNVPIYDCKDFSTLVEEKCPTCQNWDVNTCQLPEPCIDGQHYVALEPEETDAEGSIPV